MKAVIVDLLNGQAAALCEDGRVVKLADAGYSLGQTVEVRRQKRPARRWRRTLAAVAAAAVLLMGVGGGVAYAMPYGVVSLDANSSIEYTINRFDYVLSVEGVNEDGKALLAGMDRSRLVHHSIGDALEFSVSQLEADEWPDQDRGELLISAGTKREAHSEKLLGELTNRLGHGREHLDIQALTVSEEEISDAHRAGMSAGRQHMLRQLREREGDGFSAGDWAERPIGEIMRELDPARGQHADTEQPHGQAQSSGEALNDGARQAERADREEQPRGEDGFSRQERRGAEEPPQNAGGPDGAPHNGGMEALPEGRSFSGGGPQGGKPFGP